MRAIVTGQVGMDKKAFLRKVVDRAGETGERVELYNVGDLMYREAPDVKPGRILFEMDGVDEETAEEAFRLAAHKLPVDTRFIQRGEIL